ncbi:MAG: hypothetical protein FWD76_04175, partial [Firmicutes bacterium]|nr:hypothetical protein [Bacillota bacterium]
IWTDFKETNGIPTDIEVKAALLQQNIDMSLDKLPEDFLDQGYIKAHHSPASEGFEGEDNLVSLYTHLTDTSKQDSFEIVGNYFTLNAKNVPLTKAQDDRNPYGYNADPFVVGFSKVKIFNFASKQEYNSLDGAHHRFVSQDKTNQDNLIEVQPDGQRQAISNLDMRGNAPRAAEDNSGGLWAFGQMYNYGDFEVDNTIAKDFVATAEFTEYTSKRVISNSIIGNNYSFGITGWLAGDTNYIVGSELEKFGGPVFLLTSSSSWYNTDENQNPILNNNYYDMVDGSSVLIDQSESIHARRTLINVDYQTLINNPVTGYEKWFEAYGNVADQIKSMLLDPMQTNIEDTIAKSGVAIQKIPKVQGSIDTDQGPVGTFQFVEASLVTDSAATYNWDTMPTKNGLRFVDFSGKTQGTQKGVHGSVANNTLTQDDLVNDFDMGSSWMWQDRGSNAYVGDYGPVGNALEPLKPLLDGFGAGDVRLPVVQGMGTTRDAYGLYLPFTALPGFLEQDFYSTYMGQLFNGSVSMSHEKNRQIIPNLFGDNNQYMQLFAYDIGALAGVRDGIAGSMQLVLKYYR